MHYVGNAFIRQWYLRCYILPTGGLMPINDPIKGKKVAPASLAFEHGRASRRQTATSYQSNIRTANQITQVLLPTNQSETIRRDEAQNHNIWAAERRAKEHVAGYKEVTQWDIIVDLTVTTGTWDPIGFQSEVLRCQGSRFAGTASASNARWYFKPPKGVDGVWYFYSHMALVLTNAMQVTTARLGFFVDGVLFRVVDAMDVQMSNDDATYINDVILGGGCHVPIAVGQEFDVRILLESTGSGDQLLGAPTSVYGYVTGHRERCDTTQIATPTTGASFTFT